MNRKLWFFLLMIILTSFSCKKSSDVKSTGAKSQWTFSGVTYKVTNVPYVSGSNELFASDDFGAVGGGNYVRVFFGSITKPTGSLTLTVADYASLTQDPSTCSIQVGNIYDATRPVGYLSTGKAGDKVTLTVSSTGKLTTSFSNITVSDGTTFKTVSGTLVEE